MQKFYTKEPMNKSAAAHKSILMDSGNHSNLEVFNSTKGASNFV